MESCRVRQVQEKMSQETIDYTLSVLVSVISDDSNKLFHFVYFFAEYHCVYTYLTYMLVIFANWLSHQLKLLVHLTIVSSTLIVIVSVSFILCFKKSRRIMFQAVRIKLGLRRFPEFCIERSAVHTHTNKL